MNVGREISACARDESVKPLLLHSLHVRGIAPYIKSALWRQIQKKSCTRNTLDLKEAAHTQIKLSGFDAQLKNAIYQEILKLSLRGIPHPASSKIFWEELREPLDFIRTAQQSWESKLKKAIATLCLELHTPLMIERSHSDKDRLQKKWSSLGAFSFDQSNIHPIFAPSDFVKIVVSLSDPNSMRYRSGSGVLIQYPLSSTSLLDLKDELYLLHPATVTDEADKFRQASKVISDGLFSAAHEICKTGCPTEHRRTLWSMALSIDLSLPEHAFQFENLKMSVLCQQSVLDHLLMKDVKDAAANDVEYFVFEDKIQQVLLAFMMDTAVLNTFDYSCATPFLSNEVGGADDSIFPPSGVIPFHGFSMYVAPISYLFERVEHFYALFKKMYLRYFFRLHTLSSHKHGILSLCSLFETLVLSRLPELFQHLNHIGAPPLEIVFPWLMYAFSGYLAADQVLFLWDLVVGYDSLEVLAVLAVAVLEFRASNLFQANSKSDVEAILTDIHCLTVLPLLQNTLFT